ncbi:hypothetical protein BDR06DRAFT_947559 [Suillus hirtellus]|nr:hypothetical protein BDR06DRAFT_947559 [Suillus hirtellus]
MSSFPPLPPFPTASSSSLPHGFMHPSRGGLNFMSSAPPIISSIESTGRKREMQTYMMSLDGIDMEDDEQDTLFAKYSVDTVYLSYLAARNRVRQYTQLLALLKREENAWLEKVQKAKLAVPGYKPEPEGAVISLEI